MWPTRTDGSLKATMERPIAAPRWVVPRHLRLMDSPKGRSLVWQAYKTQDRVVETWHPSPKETTAGKQPIELIERRPTEKVRVRVAAGNALWDFQDLASERQSLFDHAVLKYARRYGALRLCVEHGMPDCSAPGCTTGKELIKHWRIWTGMVRSILRISSDLHRERRRDDSADWRVVLSAFPELTGVPVPHWSFTGDYPLVSLTERRTTFTLEESEAWLAARNKARLRRELAEYVNGLLDLGGVRPRIAWHRDGVRFRLDGSGLFAALARQLAFAVARIDGLAVCSSCGKAFVPDRRPRQDQLSWCKKCKRDGKDNLYHQMMSRQRP